MSIVNAANGASLPALVKPPVTQEQLQHYAGASGDSHPIHPDAEAARRVGLDGVIAHGMLSMAFLSQFVNQQIADTPEAYLASLHVRFSNMVQLGDILTCSGTVEDQQQTRQYSNSAVGKIDKKERRNRNVH